jgi:hypothetical protein
MILIEATEAPIFGLLVNQLIGFFYFYSRPYMLGLCTPLIPHTSEGSGNNPLPSSGPILRKEWHNTCFQRDGTAPLRSTFTISLPSNDHLS